MIVIFEVIKKFNDKTLLAIRENTIFVLKRISLEDVDMYKKLMQIRSPYIAEIYELTIVNGGYYAVMEYVQGQTLSQYIQKNGALDYPFVIDVSMQICNGLLCLHNSGIVHRDINPNNIIIDKYNKIKIIDFDISRIKKTGRAKDTQILGTMGFAAPEQYGFSQTNERADIYSLGVLMNYMKTGYMPNEKLATGALGNIVLKCVEIDEKNRFANVEDLMKALMGKGSFPAFIRRIPGFRNGIWWHMLTATIYYSTVPFLYYVVLFAMEGTASYRIITSLVFLFMYIVPVPIITDWGNWTERLGFFRYQKKSSLMAYKIILSGISMAIGVVFVAFLPQ